MPSTYTVAERLMEKREARTSIGWVDWSTGSVDRTQAMARAWRICCRMRGIRTDRRGNEK